MTQTNDPSLPPELGPGPLIPRDVLVRHLGACGRRIRVFRGCRLVPPERIRLGSDSQIDEDVRIYAGEGVEIGRHAHLAIGSSISGGGRCQIGDYVGIGAGVRIITGTDVTDGTGLTNPTIPSTYRAVHRGRVIIEAHVVVFTHATVLPGVKIGEGAIVAAGSVVHRDLKPWRVYAGNPLVQVAIRPAERVLSLARELEAAEEQEDVRPGRPRAYPLQ